MQPEVAHELVTNDLSRHCQPETVSGAASFQEHTSRLIIGEYVNGTATPPLTPGSNTQDIAEKFEVADTPLPHVLGHACSDELARCMEEAAQPWCAAFPAIAGGIDRDVTGKAGLDEADTVPHSDHA